MDRGMTIWSVESGVFADLKEQANNITVHCLVGAEEGNCH